MNVVYSVEQINATTLHLFPKITFFYSFILYKNAVKLLYVF